MGIALTMKLTPPWHLTDEEHPFKRMAALEPVMGLAVEAALMSARAAGATRGEAVGALFAQCLLLWSRMTPEEASETRDAGEGYAMCLLGQHEVV